MRLYANSPFDPFWVMNTFPEMSSTGHMTILAGDSSLSPYAVFPFTIGILDRLAIGQGCIIRVKLVAVFAELSLLKIGSPLNTSVIGHACRVVRSGHSFSLGRTKAVMLPYVTCGTSNSLKL